MRCPKCKQLVDPECKGRWLSLITQPHPTIADVLWAVEIWDAETVECGGQSTLPTELRDAIRNQLR